VDTARCNWIAGSAGTSGSKQSLLVPCRESPQSAAPGQRACFFLDPTAFAEEQGCLGRHRAQQIHPGRALGLPMPKSVRVMPSADGIGRLHPLPSTPCHCANSSTQ
jgi:hypothetical protein